MKCPKCNQELEIASYMDIEVNKCPDCGGMWFDYNEIDQVEDSVFDEDDFKNTMITNLKSGEEDCPVCSSKMEKFNYRWEDLELESCIHQHGFWLDKGEADRLVQVMEKYTEDIARKYKVEEEWANHLKRLQSPSFFSRLSDLIKN